MLQSRFHIRDPLMFHGDLMVFYWYVMGIYFCVQSMAQVSMLFLSHRENVLAPSALAKNYGSLKPNPPFNFSWQRVSQATRAHYFAWPWLFQRHFLYTFLDFFKPFVGVARAQENYKGMDWVTYLRRMSLVGRLSDLKVHKERHFSRKAKMYDHLLIWGSILGFLL